MRLSPTPPSATSLGGLLDEGALDPPSVARRQALERVRDGLFGSGAPVEIGRYRMLRKLGEGAMGVVYAAADPVLDREVAIKLVQTGAVSSAKARARLRNEARAMARLSHPNVVPVYEVIERAGEVAIVMELVPGTDLATWSSAPRSWLELVRALVDAGRGLVAAHAVGVVHRDFKPHNVLVGPDGRARVTDFGLAHAEESATTLLEASQASPALTKAGAIVGTPAYLAPECWAGRRATAAADQFALAVTAYELLFGHRPFHGTTIAELGRRIRLGKMLPIPTTTDVPRRIRDAIQRGLAVDPAQRHPSVDDLVVELESALRPGRQLTPFLVAAGAAVFAIALLVPSRARVGAESLPCHGFDPAGARAWTDDRRHAVSQHGDPRLVAWEEGELESYAQELRHTRAAACAGSDPAVAAAQLRCLDALERDHETTLDLLARGGLDPQRTLTIVEELEAPSRCSSAADDSVPDQDVAVLLSQARVLIRAGRARDAYAAAELACARLQRHEGAQWAECRLANGSALMLLGRRTDARPLLEEAFDVGVALRHDGIVRDAAGGLAKIAAYTGDDATARRWREELRAAGRRIGDATTDLDAALLESEFLARTDRAAEAIAVLQAVAATPEARASGPRKRLNVELRFAVMYGRLGESSRAHEHFARALATLDELPASDLPRSSLLGMRAQQFGFDGRFEDALEDYRAALALARPARGDVDGTVIKALDGIADTLTRLDRLDEARVAADENVRAAAATSNEEDLADALLTRGRMHIAASEWEAARRDAAEALALYDEGSRDKTAGAGQLLAHALMGLGQLEEARRVVEEAIHAKAAVLGEGHPDTLVIVMMLASIEEAAGHDARALELHARVRDGLIESLGPGHPAVGTASYNLALTRHRTGDLRTALRDFERAHAILQATLGDAHVDTRDAAEHVAMVRRELAAAR